jgi:hypothetical protein
VIVCTGTTIFTDEADDICLRPRAIASVVEREEELEAGALGSLKGER